jgi:hypothetical protein
MPAQMQGRASKIASGSNIKLRIKPAIRLKFTYIPTRIIVFLSTPACPSK